MFSKYSHLGFVFLFALCINSTQVKAAAGTDDTPPEETVMAHVATSYPENYTGLITVQWEGEALRSKIARFVFSDSRNTHIVYTPEDLNKGVILVHTLGKDILFIKGTTFSAEVGGPMVLTFSKTFFANDQRTVTFDFVRTNRQPPEEGREESPTWVLQTDDREGHDPFDSLFIEVYKKLGIPSGVSKIQLIDRGSLIRNYDPQNLPRVGRLRRRR